MAKARSDLWVFWINASTPARIQEGFRLIADNLQLADRNQPKADIPLLVQRWLSNERNGQWLILLDSYDDYENFDQGMPETSYNQRPLATYLPQSHNGSILITTRNKMLGSRLVGYQNIIEIGPMAEVEALELLHKKLGSPYETETSEAAVKLVQTLDMIPLAITQAAAYIYTRALKSSITKYLAEFHKSDQENTRLLEYDIGDLRRDGGATNAILTTWQISFNHIRSIRPSAADLIFHMSFFNPQGISIEMLKSFKTSTHTVRVRDRVKGVYAKLKGSSSSSGTGFEDDISILRDYCLIKINEEGDEYKMHSLVQLSTRKWLEKHGQQELMQERYIRWIVAAFPLPDYQNWETCKRLFPHINVNTPVGKGMEMKWASLMESGGYYALQQGRYDVAEQMVNTARAIYKTHTGENSAKMIGIINILALVFVEQGRWDEAEKLQLIIMEEAQKELGADHPDALMSMDNLASTFRSQGRWEDAEKLQTVVLEKSKSTLGTDHPSTLISMGNLALTFRKQGRWEEAEKLQVIVMEGTKSNMGDDHLHTLISMGNLALTFRDQGRWEEAEKLEVMVMEKRKSKLGDDHPHTLIGMGNLASTLRKQGRWGEAEKLGVLVMDKSNSKLGVDHPGTLKSAHNLALIWECQGRSADAMRLLKECTINQQRVLGSHHPDTIKSLAILEKWTNKYGNLEP